MSDKKKSTIKVSVGDSYTPTSAGSEPTNRPRPTPPGKE